MPEWRCPRCGFRTSLWSQYLFKCPRCEHPLELEYEIRFEPRGRGLFRYSSMLPFTPDKTRGEGSTPLVREVLNSVEVFFKLEYLNPSGSFKDRGSALAAYYAYRMGFDKVVEDTSGNTGISVALFARLYGLEARIIMPKTAPEGKKKLVRKLGGIVVEASDRSEAASKALEFARDHFYVAHTWSPLFTTGFTTIAYEIYEEAGVPDAIILPVGSGSLLLGVYQGFRSLVKLGVVQRIPVIYGVQGYSVQPVFKAVKGYEEKGEESTLADGVMVPNPPRLSEIASKIREAKGDVILVGNTEIAEATRELWEMGFTVEPTSAIVLAALRKMADALRGKRTALILTGSGLKVM
ncbi:MAG: pyridoxal-phosphate dependent enzyme [Thermosphaera sp.]